MAIEFFMPKMSDHMDAGVIVGWLVTEGDRIEKGDALLEIETDKATVELEAPASGIIKGIRPGLDPGVSVAVGETIAFITEPNEDAPALPPLGEVVGSGEPGREAETPVPASEPETVVKGSTRPRAAPAVRKLARDLGVDLALIKATGHQGRVTQEDVHAFIDAQKSETPDEPPEILTSPLARRTAKELGVDLAEVKGSGPKGKVTQADVQAHLTAHAGSEPVVADTETGEYEWWELSTIQRLAGERMVESVHAAPQFSLDVLVDMTQTMLFRQAQMDRITAATGRRLSITTILTKAVAIALKQFPQANAVFVDGRLKVYKGVHIGIAVGTDSGLVVPVIKHTDQKTLIEITQELADFQDKAKSLRFNPEDLSGGTFTVSNLGMFGIDRFRAIINPPESAILAVGRIVNTPVGLPDQTISLRPLMNMTLSVDHRCMDGLQGAKVLAKIKGLLEQPYLFVA
ncbi:MAG TPA: 2-oxo acid dehydrogenase subunit E2 [candidate division Zixibacteria bacterium]|nr:2-oxo acid dehydrogenase subunit E2 [candidate division Zixibacteria bacterium]